MFKKCLKRHHVVLKKGQNFHIMVTLLWNGLLMLRLRLFKWMHGIHHPIVHYYALCWNEEKMLPFMFDYYGQFIDRFTIYDNYSNDRSEKIILQHPQAEIIKYASDGIEDVIYQRIKNNCWKRSRGKADYVMVCDVDEFLYHPRMLDFLSESLKLGYSVFPTEGYDMYSEVYPEHDNAPLLTEQVKVGVRHEYYDKPIVFDPNRIVEMNFEVGAHKAYPIGIVNKREGLDGLKLLHYKNLSLEHVLQRVAVYAERLSEVNKANRWGENYLQEERRIRDEFNENLARCETVIT